MTTYESRETRNGYPAQTRFDLFPHPPSSKLSFLRQEENHAFTNQLQHIKTRIKSRREEREVSLLTGVPEFETEAPVTKVQV